MQENASVHSVDQTLDWLQANNVPLLAWPAKSPNLNINKDVQGMLARIAFVHNRKFQAVEDLSDAIQDAWQPIDRALI